MRVKRVESLFYGYTHTVPSRTCISCREAVHNGIIGTFRDMGLANDNLELIIDTPFSMERYEDIEDRFIDNLDPTLCERCVGDTLEAMRQTIWESGVVL